MFSREGTSSGDGGIPSLNLNIVGMRARSPCIIAGEREPPPVLQSLVTISKEQTFCRSSLDHLVLLSFPCNTISSSPLHHHLCKHFHPKKPNVTRSIHPPPLFRNPRFYARSCVCMYAKRNVMIQQALFGEEKERRKVSRTLQGQKQAKKKKKSHPQSMSQG